MTNHLVLLLLGYVATVLIEIPVLWFGLHPSHRPGVKLFAGFWLTACTYPIVVLVFPQLIAIGEHRTLFLLVAESFAVVAECVLFSLLTNTGKSTRGRDWAAIIAANLASFGIGETFYWLVRL